MRVGLAPANQHMLAVFAIARCPALISDGDGHRGIIFFNTPAHFFKKRVLKLLRRLHNACRYRRFRLPDARECHPRVHRDPSLRPANCHHAARHIRPRAYRHDTTRPGAQWRPAVQAVYRRMSRLVFGLRVGWCGGRLKPHGRAVHAIALAGRGRAVRKHMAQMRAAIARPPCVS